MNRYIWGLIQTILLMALVASVPLLCIALDYAMDIPEEPTPFWSEAVDVWLVEVGGIPCLMASFDLDKDGEVDYQTQREFLPNRKLWPYPTYYYINLDNDRAIDLATECWVDVPPDGDTSNLITFTEYQKQFEDEQPTDYDKLLEGSF